VYAKSCRVHTGSNSVHTGSNSVHAGSNSVHAGSSGCTPGAWLCALQEQQSALEQHCAWFLLGGNFLVNPFQQKKFNVSFGMIFPKYKKIQEFFILHLFEEKYPNYCCVCQSVFGTIKSSPNLLFNL
jgi:hypothetical protein